MKFQSPLVLVPSLVFVASLAQAAPIPSQGITVEGVCNRRAVPDRGAVTVTADVLAKDLKKAVDQATASYERVRAAVKKLPLQDMELETSEYSVHEEKEWQKERMVSKGFRARIGLRVTSTSIQRLGEVLAVASKEGIHDVGSLSSYLSPEKLKQEQMACLEEAATHARAKAEKLAQALGSKIGPLLALSELQPAAAPQPMPMMRAKGAEMSLDAAAAPGIEAGKQDISTTVYATFSLR